MTKYPFPLLLSVVLLSILQACGAPTVQKTLLQPTLTYTTAATKLEQTSPTLTFTPSQTTVPSATPIPTRTLTPTQTNTPAPTTLPTIPVYIAPISPDIPLHDKSEVIRMDNWQDLKEVAAWGKGRLEGIAYDDVSNQFKVITPIGIYYYLIDGLLSPLSSPNLVNFQTLTYGRTGKLVDFTPDGNWILVQDNQTLFVVDTRYGEILFSCIFEDKIVLPKLSSDGKFLFATELNMWSEKARFSIWDIVLGERVYNESIKETADSLSPDGKFVLLFRADSMVVLELSNLMVKHKVMIKDLPFISENYKSDYWIQRFSGPPWFLSGFSLAPGGDKAALFFQNGPIIIWDFVKNQSLGELNVYSPYSDWLTFSPNGELLASGGIYEVAVFRTADLKLLWNSKLDFLPNRVAFIDGSDTLLLQSDTSIFFNARTGDKGASLTGHNATITEIIISSDNHYAAASYQDGVIRIINLGTGREEQENQLIGRGIAFAPDGESLYLRNKQSIVRWFWRSDRQQNIIEAYPKQISLSADNRYLIFGSDLLVYDMFTGEKFLLPTNESNFGNLNIADSSFPPDSTDYFVLLEEYGGAQAFTFPDGLRSWQPVDFPLVNSTNENQFYERLTFTPDGQTVIVAGGNYISRFIAFYPFQNGTPGKPELLWLGDLENFNGDIDLAVHPEGRILAVVDERLGSGKAVLIDIENREILGAWSGKYNSAEFTKDGRFLILGGEDGIIRCFGIYP